MTVRELIKELNNLPNYTHDIPVVVTIPYIGAENEESMDIRAIREVAFNINEIAYAIEVKE